MKPLPRQRSVAAPGSARICDARRHRAATRRAIVTRAGSCGATCLARMLAYALTTTFIFFARRSSFVSHVAILTLSISALHFLHCKIGRVRISREFCPRRREVGSGLCFHCGGTRAFSGCHSLRFVITNRSAGLVKTDIPTGIFYPVFVASSFRLLSLGVVWLLKA